MSASPILATPQIYCAADLREVIDHDLAKRGIPCVVDVGQWDVERKRGEPQCWIDLGDETLAEPMGHYQPGMWWPVGEDIVAAPLLDDAATYRLRIHSPPPSSVTSNANASTGQLATKLLMMSVCAAVRRAIAAPLRQPMRAHWLTKDEITKAGYPAFFWGSVVDVVIVIASPVLDDEAPIVTPIEIDTSTSFTFLDGSATAPSAGN